MAKISDVGIKYREDQGTSGVAKPGPLQQWPLLPIVFLPAS